MRLYGTPGEIRNASEDFNNKASGSPLTLVGITSVNAATGEDSSADIIRSSSAAGEKIIYSFKAPALGEKHQILVEATTDGGETLKGDALLLGVSPKFAELQSALASRIQDAAGKLSQNDADDCIWEAITGRYSDVRPLKVVSDFIGDGVTFKWDIDETNFPGWVNDFSILSSIEYPADLPISTSRDSEPQLLEGEDWQYYRKDSSTLQVLLRNARPQIGQIVRFTYTAPRSEDGSDIPAKNFYAVADLAASLACTRLSAGSAQIGDSQFGGDAVDYRGRPTTYRQLAVDFMKAFETQLGLNKDTPQPAASVTTQWKDDGPWTGGGLTH